MAKASKITPEQAAFMVEAAHKARPLPDDVARGVARVVVATSGHTAPFDDAEFLGLNLQELSALSRTIQVMAQLNGVKHIDQAFITATTYAMCVGAQIARDGGLRKNEGGEDAAR